MLLLLFGELEANVGQTFYVAIVYFACLYIITLPFTQSN